MKAEMLLVVKTTNQKSYIHYLLGVTKTRMNHDAVIFIDLHFRRRKKNYLFSGFFVAISSFYNYCYITEIFQNFAGMLLDVITNIMK